MDWHAACGVARDGQCDSEHRAVHDEDAPLDRVDQKLSTAHAKMREYSIRHLPVLSGGRLLGMITDRDLHMVETLPDVAPTK